MSTTTQIFHGLYENWVSFIKVALLQKKGISRLVISGALHPDASMMLGIPTRVTENLSKPWESI